jgi:hypothetical protein
LQHDHARDAPVGDADGFECAELFQVFNSEDVERLACNDDPND